ncbi:MAG: YcgN family cysteine cluster protein [Rhodomicrobium sp.]|nr:YcgN family cysteine cluster protein [Rhodomicrobium sp.]
MQHDTPFWKRKRLHEMSPGEWESLCDGCARCCLIKLEDEDTGELAYTRVACKLLDIGACRCTSYEDGASKVPDCLTLTPEGASSLQWLPETCAYRRLANGEDLDWWHPLVSGRTDSVHEAGISVRGFAVSERKIKSERFERFIVKRV